MNLGFKKTVPHYAVANIVTAALLFSLIPILTRSLNTEQLGKVFIFQAIATVFFAFIGLGSQSILQNIFFGRSEEFPSYVSSTLANISIATIVAAIFISFFGQYFFDLFHLEPVYIFYALFIGFLMYLKSFVQMFYQTSGLSKTYLVTAILSSLTAWCLTIYILTYIYQDWLVRILGLNAELVVFSIFFIFSVKLIGVRKPTALKMKELFLRGYPIIFHSCSMLLINQTDRFMLAALMGEGAVGIYGVGGQLASSIGMFGGALAMAYTPILYQRLASPSEKNIAHILKLRRWAITAVLGAGVLLLVVVLNFSSLILGNDFNFDSNSFILLSLGNVVFSWYHLYCGYFYHYKGERYLFVITFSIALINIALSFALIPTYGLLGAAIGTLFAFVSGFICAYLYFRVKSRLADIQYGEKLI